MNRRNWKEKDRRLERLVKTLKKTTKLSELCKLDKQYPGILIKFWREYGRDPNFVHWMTDMEKQDPNWEEYENSIEEPSNDPEPIKIEDNIIEDEELTVQEKIELIRKKYGNND